MNPLNSLFVGPWYIWFVAGMASVQIWQWIKCKWKDHTDPEGAPHKMKKLNWFYVWTAAVMIVIVGVGVQSLRTYTYAEELAAATADCQVQFNKALKSRAQINDEDRELVVDWQHATLDRARALINLQNTFGNTSPEYFSRKSDVDNEYFLEISRIENERAILEKRRAEVTPYPEPTCGKDVRK